MRSLAEQQQIGGMYCATYDELKKDKSRILDFRTSYREFTLDTERILNDHDTSNTKKYQLLGLNLEHILHLHLFLSLYYLSFWNV